jgi:signal transduction histidine kinase
MEILILTTFAIILGFACINAVVSFISYLGNKEYVYKIITFFWTTLIINFILQAAAKENKYFIMASFSFSLIPVNLLCLSLFAILDKKYFAKYLFIFSVLCILTSAILCFSNQGFLITALPLSFAASIPLGITAYQLFNADRNRGVFGLIGFILILFLIHGFNFAFFRMDPTNQLWGWPIAYALYQAIAVLLPTATLAEFHYRESGRMKKIIEKQTDHLEISNKKLKNSVAFKKFLFRTLSHDIATPLLIANTSLIFFKNQNEKLAYDVNIERIDKAVQKMIQISDDLRQIESKNLEIKNYSVLECIRSCESGFNSMLENKKLKIIYDQDELQQFGVYVHKTSFVNSVLGNLIRNSIKFSPTNSLIKINSGFEDENHVWIKITNNAKSIPKIILDNIFDFGFNKSTIGTQGESGTGWGLPICKMILENYEGLISMNSIPIKSSPFDMIEVKILLKGKRFDLNTLDIS